MAPVVTRLILSFSLIIATPTLFFLALFLGFEVFDDWIYGVFGDDDWFFLPVSLCALAFFGVGWWLIWRGEVRWTRDRVIATFAVLGGSVLFSFLVGSALATMVRWNGVVFGSTIGGLIWVVLWLFGTAIAWRETRTERSTRLASMGLNGLACPGCGYNLSGLRESRCPECGASFTLDQLFAALDEQRRSIG